MSPVGNTAPATESTGREALGDELREVGSGSSPATPAWLLLSVLAAVAALFAVDVTLVSLAYLLS